MPKLSECWRLRPHLRCLRLPSAFGSPFFPNFYIVFGTFSDPSPAAASVQSSRIFCLSSVVSLARLCWARPFQPSLPSIGLPRPLPGELMAALARSSAISGDLRAISGDLRRSLGDLQAMCGRFPAISSDLWAISWRSLGGPGATSWPVSTQFQCPAASHADVFGSFTSFPCRS